MVSDDTGLMLDCGRAEELRLRWIVLRNLRGKVEDPLFRSLQPFYSLGIPETVNRKERKVIRSNPKQLSEIQGIHIADNEVCIGKAK
jgi:hypothetical protein